MIADCHLVKTLQHFGLIYSATSDGKPCKHTGRRQHSF